MENTRESGSVAVDMHTEPENYSQYQTVDNMANAPRASFVQTCEEVGKFIGGKPFKVYDTIIGKVK